VFYLADLDLSPGTPQRSFLEHNKVDFAVETNSAAPKWTEAQGAATYQALSETFRDRFLGFIHGEALGTVGVGIEDRPLAPERAGHLDALGASITAQQLAEWKRFLHLDVARDFLTRGISCLSSDLANALAHELHQLGARLVGYEEDATNVHVPMRLAFQRGAARQFGAAFINYASGNFGDACNYFTPTPPVACGSNSWFHSKYAVTDGVTIGWYRKLYYLNYLGGASAIFWEQGLMNQFMQPGPGTHPVELSPFGRVTADFLAFLDRVPSNDRGEPYTPMAVLLGYGHGYERTSFRSRMLDVFDEEPADLAVRALFDVLWFPSAIGEGMPATPDLQSLPSGVFGSPADVLVDRPERARAIFDYPLVWAVGDVRLGGAFRPILDEYLRRGGTLVLDAANLAQLDAKLTGVRATGKQQRAERFTDLSGAPRETTPFTLAEVTLDGAQPIATTDGGAPLVVRHAVGPGAVITVLVPHGVGLDERAHPILPPLANALLAGLSPVEVRLADGRHPTGEVMFQLSRTRRGWLVLLINNRGVEKTQNGLPRVDRRANVDVELVTRLPVREARELTSPHRLSVEPTGMGKRVRVRVEPGDLQVIDLVTR
jgi:hypothetical protein